MKRLMELRKSAGLSQFEVAKKIDVSRQAYCHYETGRRQPTLETLSKLASFFSVSTDYLLEKTEIKKDPVIQNEILLDELEMHPIPLLGRVVAGIPLESQENFEGYVYINYRPKDEYFALQVFGDSMINAGIPDGAILIVHKQSYAENGSIVVAFLNGEQTVKYFKFTDDDIYLVPANNNYLPIHIKKTDDFMILGEVVETRIINRRR
jgi:repressor LexA